MRRTRIEKALDWDFIFKAGLIISIVLSSILLLINYFYKLTSYPIIMFFLLPVLWAIVGMLLARKYSSAEQRSMHKVSDFGVLSLCGYFGAFFLTLYGLKTKSTITFIAAVLVYLIFYYYSWKSIKSYLTQKNIPLNWSLVWIIGGLLFMLAVGVAILQAIWNVMVAGVVLVIGIFLIFNHLWEKLVRQFWYSRQSRIYLEMGLAFNFLSLVLWVFVFIVVGMILFISG